jgi:hypothetical protein
VSAGAGEVARLWHDVAPPVCMERTVPNPYEKGPLILDIIDAKNE